jgi:hypothetical protein
VGLASDAVNGVVPVGGLFVGLLHVEPLVFALSDVLLHLRNLSDDILRVVWQVVDVNGESVLLILVQIGLLHFRSVLAANGLLFCILRVLQLFRLEIVHGRLFIFLNLYLHFKFLLPLTFVLRIVLNIFSFLQQFVILLLKTVLLVHLRKYAGLLVLESDHLRGSRSRIEDLKPVVHFAVALRNQHRVLCGLPLHPQKPLHDLVLHRITIPAAFLLLYLGHLFEFFCFHKLRPLSAEAHGDYLFA